MSNIVKSSNPSNPVPHSYYGPNAAGPGLDPSDERLDLHRFVSRLLKRKYQVLAVMLIVLIPAAIATYMATPLYRSSVLIQINPDPVQVLPFREVGDLSNATPYFEIYMKTQEQVFRGPTLRARVSQRLRSEKNVEVMRSEIPWLSRRLEIRRIENSQLLEASYLAPVPEIAASIVNMFAEEYIKELFQSRQQTREKARKMLEGELGELEQRVQASETELVRYARDNNMVSTELGQAVLVEQKLATLAKQLTDSEADVVVARSKLEIMKKASVQNFPEKLLTPNLEALNSTILSLEHELTSLRSSYGENWPVVVQKRNEISLVRDQLIREKTSVLARAIEQAQLDLLAAESRQRMISNSMSQQQQLVDRYRNASIQYNILRREVETSQKLYEGLMERLKQTSITAGLEFGNIQVVEPGRPDHEADRPKVVWILSLASVLGLGLGVCFALAMDFWDNSISTIEEAEEFAAFPALGSVPTIRATKAPALIGSGGKAKLNLGSVLDLRSHRSAATYGKTNWSPDLSEAIRTICASILLSKSDRPPRIIMVTSATPAEGKTTLVNHLGQVFAENGNKTLLIESDLRKPMLAKALGIGDEGGLSLFLSGLISSSPTIHNTSNTNLFVVTAGPKAPNPVALLNSEKLSVFLNDMASSYQFVLLDAPPLLAVADARILCRKVDGVVMVVRAGCTPKNLVRRAWMMLENSGANVMGMVLNGVTHDNYQSSYYQGYYQ